MKKLVLVLAVAFSASLFSCGNKAENAAANDVNDEVNVNEVAEGVEAIVPDTLPGDSIVPDTLVAVAGEVAAEVQ